MAGSAAHVISFQGTGGSVLFNVSKAVMNPGENFGPYTCAKAALLALMKQACTLIHAAQKANCKGRAVISS
jgi:hypothetical protein